MEIVCGGRGVRDWKRGVFCGGWACPCPCGRVSSAQRDAHQVVARVIGRGGVARAFREEASGSLALFQFAHSLLLLPKDFDLLGCA